MTVSIGKLAGTAIVAAMMMTAARAQAPVPDGPRYVITYIEVMPTAVADGAALAREMREAMRREVGNFRSEALQRIGRTNQFVLLTTWKDQAALDAHAKLAATARFDDKLKPIQDAPADERVTFPLAVGPLPTSFGTDTVLVVTHVDVIPTQRETTAALLKAHADDGRHEPGNLRFEALTQTNRQNHFTVIEAWQSRDAAQAHSMTAATRTFRDKVAPAIGALYDERFYKALD